VARGNARQNRARQRTLLAKDGLACDNCGNRPSRWDTQRVHRFADQVFTQHGPECCPAVAGARKGRGTRTFELNVTTTSVAIDHLAEE
jgi:Cys-tRNA synthase (O-phospho-L-seryl-tRNA:Cys-tRNA synthase)